jgi:signal transduction histidine kinase
MLTALDTLKSRGGLDERALKTLGLVERGLLQVRDTVGALLVEARPQDRRLEPHDLHDIHTLMQPMAAKRRVQLAVEVDLAEPIALPAGPVRQVLINLLNNAVQAAASDAAGWVRAAASVAGGFLHLAIANNGPPLSPEQQERLFEPFVSFREGGHGLGLWVTYQLVEQMRGKIAVECREEQVLFSVHLPLEPQEEMPA